MSHRALFVTVAAVSAALLAASAAAHTWLWLHRGEDPSAD